jgi:hypothetical protein
MCTVLVSAASLATGFISDKSGGTNSVTPSDEPGTMTAQMLTRAGSADPYDLLRVARSASQKDTERKRGSQHGRWRRSGCSD